MTRFEMFEGRRLERLIGISDAVTAVAITLPRVHRRSSPPIVE